MEINPENSENLLPQDGEVFIFPGYFAPHQSNDYFATLLKEVPWKQEPIILYGKEIMQPRLTCWFGDPAKSYGYSGIVLKANPWSKTLKDIKQKIEIAAKVNFNSVLLNLYRNEKDSVSWHRDNEPELGRNPVIGSVSFGATRTFQLRHFHLKHLKKSVELTHGTLLVMKGRTQVCWEHCLPKRSRPLGMRINLTFRMIK